MKVSVCIPTFERPEYVERAIDSVLSQDYQDFEIIITDDSSSDSVKNLISLKYKDNPKVFYQKNSVRLGAPENWNAAIRLAKGELIKILHHDDWLIRSNCLSKFIDVFQSMPSIDFVACSSINYDSKGNPNRVTQLSKKLSLFLKSNRMALFSGNLIGAPSVVMYRKNLNEWFDIQMKWVVDLDFYIRAIGKSRGIWFIDEPLVGVTILDQERVTHESQDNGFVELKEYLMFYQKISKYPDFSSSPISFLWSLFNKYSIDKKSELIKYVSDQRLIDRTIERLLWQIRMVSIIERIVAKAKKVVSPPYIFRLIFIRNNFILVKLKKSSS